MTATQTSSQERAEREHEKTTSDAIVAELQASVEKTRNELGDVLVELEQVDCTPFLKTFIEATTHSHYSFKGLL